MSTLSNSSASSGSSRDAAPGARTNTRTSKMSYEERLAYAESKGLKGDLARQYANADRTNSYHDTFWDRFRKFFGGKLGSEDTQESLDLEDSALINELLNAQREQDYNDPAAQAERLRNAGINPDLDPGNLGSGEASQIDDEVLGSGLSEQLSAAHQSATDLPLQVASSVMDAAGSVMSLVTGGFNLSNLIFQMDQSEMSNVFDFANKINDLGGYLPILGIQYDDVNRSFYDDEGNLTLERMSDKVKNDLMKRMASYRHPRTRRQVEQMYRSFDSAKTLESFFRTKTGQKNATRQFAEEGKALAELTGSSDSSMDSLFRNPHYRSTCDLAVQLYNIGLEAQLKVSEFQTKYYDALESGDVAELEAHQRAWEADQKTLQAGIQSQVYEKLADWMTELKNSDDPFAQMLLLSVMSGGFKQLGFDSPFELPEKLLDKLGGIVDWASNFIPGLGTLKGVTAAAQKVQMN